MIRRLLGDPLVFESRGDRGVDAGDGEDEGAYLPGAQRTPNPAVASLFLRWWTLQTPGHDCGVGETRIEVVHVEVETPRCCAACDESGRPGWGRIEVGEARRRRLPRAYLSVGNPQSRG